MTEPFECQDARKLGFDPDRLARIGSFLQQGYVDSGRLPMTQLVVARDSQPVYYNRQGRMGEGREALRDDAIFRLASMTKPVTSFAFMQLVEQCKVALEEPVTKVLPEFAVTSNFMPVVADRSPSHRAHPLPRCVSSIC